MVELKKGVMIGAGVFVGIVALRALRRRGSEGADAESVEEEAEEIAVEVDETEDSIEEASDHVAAAAKHAGAATKKAIRGARERSA